MKSTWDNGTETPKYEAGLPDEIHIWSSPDRDLFILRFAGGPLCGRWYRWHEGVAIKDVGLNG